MRTFPTADFFGFERTASVVVADVVGGFAPFGIELQKQLIGIFRVDGSPPQKRVVFADKAQEAVFYFERKLLGNFDLEPSLSAPENFALAVVGAEHVYGKIFEAHPFRILDYKRVCETVEDESRTLPVESYVFESVDIENHALQTLVVVRGEKVLFGREIRAEVVAAFRKFDDRPALCTLGGGENFLKRGGRVAAVGLHPEVGNVEHDGRGKRRH